MSNVLIGVGGSGQHIIHAYLRVLALGNAGAVEVPHVYIIDADAQSQQIANRRSQLVPDIQSLHEYLRHRGIDNKTREANFDIIRPYSQNLSSSNDLTVKNVLLAQKSKTTEEIQAFFYEKDLNIKVSEGMHANPKVGSTIFGEKLGRVLDGSGKVNTANKALLQQEFLSLFDDDVTGINTSGCNIVIVGSVFGGTGSGIIPTLARTFNEIINSSGSGRTVNLATVATLPWFQLKPGEDGLTGSAFDTGKLKRNTAFALRNFQHELQSNSNNAVSSIFIQSGSMWQGIQRPSAGDFDQPEHTHVVNLLAANAVQHSFARHFAPNELYMPMTQLSHEIRQGQFHPHTSAALQFKDFSKGQGFASLWMLLIKNALSILVMQAFIEVLNGYSEGGINHTVLGDSAAQYDTVHKLLEEISERFGVSHESKKAWFGLKSVTFVPKVVATNLKDALAFEQKQYQSSLTWLSKHDYDNNNASGIIPAFRAYHNISSADNANSLWSKLVGANDQTGFEKDELWQSCAMKVLEKTILSDQGGIDTTLQAKINTIIDQGGTNADKYAQLASNIGSLVFKNLNKYVRPSEEFGETFADYRNSDDTAQSISQVQLQMQQQKGNIAHYGAMDWNLQLAGDVAALDIMDIQHPKTLHWLDALSPTSTTANLINTIQLDESVAQGVPNILAAFLLQKWRLQIQNEITVSQLLENNQTEYYKIIANKFQSTEQGLYLYAQRVIEAAFWLLISGSTEVAYTSIALEDNNAYHRWLKRELLTQNWSDSELGMIVTNDSDRTPLFLWNGYYWCLAANNTAQEYFAGLLQSMQLPSLRYRYADLFSRKTSGDKNKISSLDKFFAGQLNVLKSRLKNSPSANKNAHENILLTALTGILTDLPPPAPTSIVEAMNPTLTLGCRNVVTLSEIGTSKSVVKTSSYLIKNPQVVMLDKLPDNNGNVVNIEQFLPVKKEYWLDPEVIAHLSKDNSEAVYTRVKFNGESNNECSIQYTKLYVPDLGWMEFPYRGDANQTTIAITPYDLAFGVGVWPNFKVEGWRYYFITVDIEKRNVYEDLASKLHTTLGSDKMTVTVYSQDLTESKIFGFDAIPLKVEFVPAIIELSCGDTVIATQPIILNENIKSGDSHIKCIGLDFGTSNTCMAKAYKDQGQIKRENLNLANTADEPRMEWLVYSEADDIKGQEEWLKNRSAYYLQRQANVSKGASYTIPSEILLGLSNRANSDDINQTDVQLKSMKESADKGQVLINGLNLNAPIFTPLCSDFLGVSNSDDERIKFFNSLLESNDIQRIYGNIKWPQDTGGSDYPLSSRLRSIYIEQVLIGVLARLRFSGATDIDYVYVTRPDAFMFENTTFANTYARDMKTILERLVKQTGVTIKKPEVIEVSETEAALQMSMINPNESYVIIDMGGGTTDIDIELSYEDYDKAIQRLKYSSSIKWAGNDLLSAMLTPKSSPIRKFLEHKIDMQSEDSNAKYYETLLASVMKLQIRNDIRIIDELPSDPGEVSKVAEMFFESIYEYIFVKIKLLLQQAGFKSIDHLKNQKLNIVLQGNGFKLSDYFSHDTHPHPAINEGHYAPAVWNTVFADFMGWDDIELNVSYSENSKEHMIRDGAGGIADQMYDNNIGSALEHPKMLYPPNMFDKNTTSGPVLVNYDKDETIPRLNDNLLDKENLLPVLENLFPYTKKYWNHDTEKVAYLFINNKYGNRHFYDVNAMYLNGSGSGTDRWNFNLAMTQKLQGN
ncbi:MULTISPECIES: tubulin-like doman-containing protein [Psychrobacter]|uniref:Uncharacterized protein n=1 Tax=Psychrobacter alimentarius TaxID=261164 RepID=A0ABM5ZYS8_9GAMM|nr:MULTISPECIES: tubulin-like doman-containing protein [Psychrobacter]AMT97256.1 hypothetical protein A3K91_1656 [Psychrobacter alimentarius]